MNHTLNQDLYSQDCALRLLISPFDPSQAIQDDLTAASDHSTLSSLVDNHEPSMPMPSPTDFTLCSPQTFASNNPCLPNQPIAFYTHLMTSDSPYPSLQPAQEVQPMPSSFHPYFNPSENTLTNQVQIQRIQQTKRQARSLGPLSEKIDFDDITVAELKEALRKRGLSVAGRKAELMDRLRQEASSANVPLSITRHRRHPNKRSPRSPEPYPFISSYSAPEASGLYLNDVYIKKHSGLSQTNRKVCAEHVFIDCNPK